MIIFGKGGHSGAVADAVKRSHPDEDFIFIDESTKNFEMIYKGSRVFVAIGDNAARERISKMDFGFDFNICHPCSIVPAEVVMTCKNSFFGAFSIIGHKSTVGNFTIINTGVVLEHDSSVGDFSHLCPGVVTGGRVKIGNRTTIGVGAMIRDGITIGKNCVIGMGAVVTKHVLDNSIVYGNPATLRGENK